MQEWIVAAPRSESTKSSKASTAMVNQGTAFRTVGSVGPSSLLHLCKTEGSCRQLLRLSTLAPEWQTGLQEATDPQEEWETQPRRQTACFPSTRNQRQATMPESALGAFIYYLI